MTFLSKLYTKGTTLTVLFFIGKQRTLLFIVRKEKKLQFVLINSLVENRLNSELYWCILLDFPQILFKTNAFYIFFSTLVSFLFLFSSLVSFAFCLCVFINKNIYCDTHRLCGRVTDKKFFTRPISENKITFFFLFPWYISWQKVQLYYK